MLEGHDKRITSIAITTDNLVLVSESYDETIIMWDLPTYNKKYVIEDSTFNGPCIAITSDNSLLITNSYDTIKVWDFVKRKQISELSGHRTE